MNTINRIFAAVIIVLLATPTLAFAQEESTVTVIVCNSVEECQEEIRKLQEENAQYKRYLEDQGLTEDFEESLAGPLTEEVQDSEFNFTTLAPYSMEDLIDFTSIAACGHTETMRIMIIEQYKSGATNINQSVIYEAIAGMAIEDPARGVSYSYNDALQAYHYSDKQSGNDRPWILTDPAFSFESVVKEDVADGRLDPSCTVEYQVHLLESGK